jgi:hypothetical protein
VDLKAAHARALADLEDAMRAERAAENVLVLAREHASEMRSLAEALDRAMTLYDKPAETVEGVSDSAVMREAVYAPASAKPASAENGFRLLYDGQEPSITNLSHNMVQQFARPASTEEVRLAIAKAGGKKYNAGEDFNQDQVRNALQWLMKSGRVERVSPGTWRIVRQPGQPQDDFAPADQSAGASMTVENDTSRQDGVLNGATRFPQPAR